MGKPQEAQGKRARTPHRCANPHCLGRVSARMAAKRSSTRYCSRQCANADPRKRQQAAATMRAKIAAGQWTWEAALRAAQDRPEARALRAARLRQYQRDRVARGQWQSPSRRPEVAAKISATRLQQERRRRLARQVQEEPDRRYVREGEQILR